MTEVLVGTRDGLHWLSGPRAVEGVDLAGHEVNALAADGESRWAITDARQLWRAASGRSWEFVAEISGPGANCLCPTPSGLLVGTTEAHLHRLETHRPITSWTSSGLTAVDGFDQVEGREEWYTPWGGPPDVRSISRGQDGSIYANVHVGGIVRSRDDGASWEPTIDIHSDVHQVVAAEGHGGLVVAACAKGLVGSDDGGDTWIFETEGLHSTYCRAVAVGADTVYLSASAGPRGGRAALYRIPIAGGSFERCGDGLPEWFSGNIDTFCVAASGSEVALGTEDGSVYASADGGRTWDEWATGLPPLRCIALG